MTKPSEMNDRDLFEEIEVIEEDLVYFNEQLISMEKMVDEMRVRCRRAGDRFDVLLPEAKQRKLIR